MSQFPNFPVKFFVRILTFLFFFYSEGILLDSRLFNFLSSIPHQVIFHLEKEKVVRLILSIHRYERVDIENNFLMRIYNVKIVRGRDYFLKSY